MLERESFPERSQIGRTLRQADPLAREIIQDFLRTTVGFLLVVTVIVSAVALLQ